MTDVDRLYAVPLEDFVAERKQVAKELRAAGDREAAAEVAKLPKPTPPAWALNRLARDEPDAVGEWLEAAAALRAASENPGAGLRSAMADHREATRKLLGAVRDGARPGGRPLSEPMLERVRALLAGATADPALADALRRGTVVEAGEDAGRVSALTAAGEEAEADGVSASTAAGEGSEDAGRGSGSGVAARASGRGADSAPAARDRDSKRAAKEREAEQEAERREREQAARLAELERRVEAALEELARLRDEAEAREAAAVAADERLDEARRTLHRSESEASAAHDAADEASEAVATAERELKQVERQLRSARGAA